MTVDIDSIIGWCQNVVSVLCGRLALCPSMALLSSRKKQRWPRICIAPKTMRQISIRKTWVCFFVFGSFVFIFARIRIGCSDFMVIGRCCYGFMTTIGAEMPFCCNGVVHFGQDLCHFLGIHSSNSIMLGFTSAKQQQKWHWDGFCLIYFALLFRFSSFAIFSPENILKKTSSWFAWKRSEGSIRQLVQALAMKNESSDSDC